MGLRRTPLRRYALRFRYEFRVVATENKIGWSSSLVFCFNIRARVTLWLIRYGVSKASTAAATARSVHPAHGQRLHRLLQEERPETRRMHFTWAVRPAAQWHRHLVSVVLLGRLTLFSLWCIPLLTMSLNNSVKYHISKFFLPVASSFKWLYCELLLYQTYTPLHKFSLSHRQRSGLHWLSL